MLAAFALTTGKDAVKNEDLAKQLETARQESSKLRQESAKLRQQLEESHEETKAIIQRENKKLRSEDSKLKREDDKLKAEAEELRKENKKLRRQDEELRQRDAELEREVNKLHQAFRQRDQNNTLELVRNSFGFRQMDFTAELKKLMDKQIKEYLDENKMCVMGVIEQSLDRSRQTVGQKVKIEFGHTFQRIPAFAAAVSGYALSTDGFYEASLYNFNQITTSSAVVSIRAYRCSYMHFVWIACL